MATIHSLLEFLCPVFFAVGIGSNYPHTVFEIAVNRCRTNRLKSYGQIPPEALNRDPNGPIRTELLCVKDPLRTLTYLGSSVRTVQKRTLALLDAVSSGRIP